MAAKVKSIAAVTVAAAGTAVQVSTTDIRTAGVIIQSIAGNTGILYVGDSTVDSTNGLEIAVGASVEISTPNVGKSSTEISLQDLFIDAATNGDEARVIFFGNRN